MWLHLDVFVKRLTTYLYGIWDRRTKDLYKFFDVWKRSETYLFLRYFFNLFHFEARDVAAHTFPIHSIPIGFVFSFLLSLFLDCRFEKGVDLGSINCESGFVGALSACCTSVRTSWVTKHF